jgi:poly(3-hydroxybutyrate) depolymerase
MRRTLPVCLLTIALASIAAPPGMAQEPTCSSALTNGTESRALGGRSYLVNVPLGVSGDRAPLLVSIHGFSGSPRQQEQGTGWTPFAGAQGEAQRQRMWAFLEANTEPA